MFVLSYPTNIEYMSMSQKRPRDETIESKTNVPSLKILAAMRFIKNNHGDIFSRIPDENHGENDYARVTRVPFFFYNVVITHNRKMKKSLCICLG